MPQPPGKTLSECSPDSALASTRVFNVPREVLFRAFSDPRHLAHWWGPRGFTNTLHEFDLRPGGRWRLTLHGPDGTDYTNEKHFLEVAAPARIVFQHVQPMHSFQMTMTFSPEATGTRLTWRLLFASAEEADRLRDLIVAANEENFDRLEAYLPEVA